MMRQASLHSLRLELLRNHKTRCRRRIVLFIFRARSDEYGLVIRDASPIRRYASIEQNLKRLGIRPFLQLGHLANSLHFFNIYRYSLPSSLG